MEFFDAIQIRKSIRKYTDEPISDEVLGLVIQAGLSSASGRGIRPWELIVVRSQESLRKLADCREGAAQMLKGAAAAIVVIAKDDVSDTWIEDSSIVMANMHLAAASLGLGSCWIQGRLRMAPTGQTTEEFCFELLNIPGEYHLEAILSLGIPQVEVSARPLENLVSTKVHWDHF